MRGEGRRPTLVYLTDAELEQLAKRAIVEGHTVAQQLRIATLAYLESVAKKYQAAAKPARRR